MSSRSVIAHPALQPRTFNPVLAKKILVASYDVKDLFGVETTYLNNAVPQASWTHRGNGWTRVSVPTRHETELVRHLVDGKYDYRRL